MSRKPLRLSDKQIDDICEMLATGSSRSTAAQFAGCHPATMRAEMRRNSDFAQRVIQAELTLEAIMLRAIREAASDPKQWRAAAWALERIYPNRYAKRRSNTLTVDQVHELVSEVSEIVAAELPVPKFRQRIFDRLAVLVTSVQIRARSGLELKMSFNRTPSNQEDLKDPRLATPAAIDQVRSRLHPLHPANQPTPPTNTVPESLLDWSKRFLPHHFRLKPSKMHTSLADQLDSLHRGADNPVCRRGQKLNILGPRGGAKSTLVTLAFFLRAALENREPYIWIVSDTRHQAITHLENLKDELADNAELAKVYPFLNPERSLPAAAGTLNPRTRASAIRLPNGVAIEAFGTGQRIRGRRRRANRPTLIVCDDIQNDSHIESARQRERSRAWFEGMLLKAGTKRTNIIHLATALHRDAIGLVLMNTPGWNSHRFAAIEQWPHRMDLWRVWEELYANLELDDSAATARQFYIDHRAEMDAGAELLWPDEEDLYTLMCMRVEGGRTAFEREKQNIPTNPDLCEWPEEYFDRPIWFDQWPDELQVCVIALDPSKGGDAKTADDSAFVLLGVDRAGVLYVEADLAPRPAPQIVADGVEHCRRFRADVLGIETNQFQELFAGEFAAAFAAQGLLQMPIEPLENTTNKLVRIRRLGPLLSQRQLRFKSHSRGTQRLVDQLRAFPIDDHDDGPDALEMATRLAAAWLSAKRYDDGLGNRLRLSD